jgi:hypothetical protein
MPNAFVLDVSVGPDLELMPVVGADLADPKWECANHMVDKVDSVCLGVSSVGLERTDVCRIVDGSVLEPTGLLAAFFIEYQKFDGHLDRAARGLLVVELRVHLAHTGASR